MTTSQIPEATPAVEAKPSPTRRESGYWEPYAEYHRNVRLWLIAYGIGVPIFLAQYPNAIQALKGAHELRSIAFFFLAGVVLQIITALLYKTAMWYLYMEEIGELSEKTRRYRLSSWASGEYWLELLLDLLTIGLFACATWRAVTTLT